MRPVGIATAQQLAILKEVLEQYCLANGISGERNRDDIAASILRLFDQGLHGHQELMVALADIAARAEGRTP